MPDSNSETQSQSTIARFLRRFGEAGKAYRQLLYYAALPLVLTPELLNYLRHQFLYKQVDWVAEVDILLSDLCVEVGYEQYAMDTAVRDCLLQEMKAELGEARMQEVARLLLGYINHRRRTEPFIAPEELQFQQWAAMVYFTDPKRGQEKVVQQIAQAFKNCVSHSELDRLSRFTQQHASQLTQSRALVDYAKLVADFLVGEKVQKVPLFKGDLGGSNRTYNQPVTISSEIELPAPRKLIQQIERGRNWGIAVGINRYQHFNGNQYAVRDGEVITNWFQQSEFAEVHSLSETTYTEFQLFLRSHFTSSSLTSKDIIWFYFSGLGVTSGERDYLLFSDSNLEDLEQTAIAVGDLAKRLLKSGTGRLILLLDSDRWGKSWYDKEYDKEAEPLPTASELGQALIRQSEINPKKQGMLAFYACHTQEGAYEIDDFQHGLFTHALREAVQNLRGENLSAQRLYQSLSDRAVELARKYIHASQTPELVAAPNNLREQILLLAPTFTFETVTVNRRGKIIKRESKTAQYYAEDLGNGITLDMVAVPGGKFLMGTEDKEIERLVKKFDWDGYRREKPQHEVTVPPFFMSKYPITQAQWRTIASRTDLKVERELKPNPSHFKGDNRPVEQVTWYDAVEFCARLSKLTGREYRLPSEAEWEHACRAGTTTPFYFGETITGELANYDASQTYADEPKGEERGETTPVGQFPPNGFGLYDMHGNVWEWCLDDWHDNYEDAPTDGSPWLNRKDSQQSASKVTANDKSRVSGDLEGSDTNDNYSQQAVLRGGSWLSVPLNCRSADRDWNRRDHDNQNFGFRVCCGSGRTLF